MVMQGALLWPSSGLGGHLAREVTLVYIYYLESPGDLDKNLYHEALVSSFYIQEEFILFSPNAPNSNNINNSEQLLSSTLCRA